MAQIAPRSENEPKERNRTFFMGMMAVEFLGDWETQQSGRCECKIVIL
jgi:hypothetical protein